MTKRHLHLLALALALAAYATFTALEATPAQARAPSAAAPAARTQARQERLARLQAEMRANYQAALARNEAAARAHAAGQAPAPEPSPCAEGLVAWRRGEGVNLCVVPCTSDTDCASFERCRVIGHGAGPTEPARFADEQPLLDGERATGVCDPFYDVRTAISATYIGPEDTAEDLATTPSSDEL